MQNKIAKGYILSILSAVIYGLMPLMAKYIYAEGVNALSLVFLRNLLALPTLGLLTFIKHRTLKIPLNALPKVSLISFFGCCMTSILSALEPITALITGIAFLGDSIPTATVAMGSVLVVGASVLVTMDKTC